MKAKYTLLILIGFIFCCTTNGFAQNQAKTIMGTVTDAQTGDPLIGVNILVKGTTTGTVTNSQGHYSLTVSSLQDTLRFSYIGYQTKTVPINGRTVINVALQPQVISGQQVVVIGYGTKTQKELTGSVSTVQAKSLTNQPAANIAQTLGGKAAGVRVTRLNGAPGATSMIRVRGGNSIKGSNKPLYVVDGLIVGKNFNLNNINATNIKSINILKGAAAIGIYGTRGSNGVVLITTKTGSGLGAGHIQVTLNMYGGIQKRANPVHLLNGYQQAKYSNEYAKFTNAALPYPNLTPTSVPNTNWYDLITHPAPIAKTTLGVSGVTSNGNVNYYVSGSYFNQQGIIYGSGYHKYHFRANADIRITDHIKTGFRLNISRNYQKINKVNFRSMLRFALPSRAVYNEDGAFTALNPVSASVQANPVAQTKLITDFAKITNILGNAYLQINPIKGLIIKSTIGPELNYYKRNRYFPSTLPTKRIIDQGGDGVINGSNYTNLLNNNTIEYKRDINVNNYIDVLGGFTWQVHQLEGFRAHAFGFNSNKTKFYNLGVGSDPSRNVVGSNWGSFQLVSWLARINYSFRNTYLLTLVGRVDGSSRFATTKNRFGFFPAAAFAWRLSNEPFMKHINVISNLKLKASYGLSGSQAIGSYRSLALLSGTTTLFSEAKNSGVRLGRPANPNLTWETTKELNIGLNMGFLGGRLTFSTNFYHKKTINLLLNVQIPRQTGFKNKLENVGAVRNSGLEFAIYSNNIVNQNFQWSTNLMLSGNRSKVLSLGGVRFINLSGGITQYTPSQRLIVGKPVPVFVGVNYLGTWKSQEQIDNSTLAGTGQVVGGPHFQDANGDGQVTIQDFHPLGSPQPIFYGGINNHFHYKNFDVNIYFQGSYGNEVYNAFFRQGVFNRTSANKLAIVKNRWTPNNQDSNIPRAGAAVSNARVKNNSMEVRNGSYLRLKNLRVAYSLPVKKLGITTFSQFNIFFSGQNLLLITNFMMGDPEVSRYGDSNTEIGFTNGTYPYSKVFTLGINVTF